MIMVAGVQLLPLFPPAPGVLPGRYSPSANHWLPLWYVVILWPSWDHSISPGTWIPINVISENKILCITLPLLLEQVSQLGWMEAQGAAILQLCSVEVWERTVSWDGFSWGWFPWFADVCHHPPCPHRVLPLRMSLSYTRLLIGHQSHAVGSTFMTSFFLIYFLKFLPPRVKAVTLWGSAGNGYTMGVLGCGHS